MLNAGSTDTAAQWEPSASGERAEVYPVSSNVRSKPIPVPRSSAPSWAMDLIAVRADSVAENTTPLFAPIIALSFTNVPSRPASPIAAMPCDRRRTYPISPDSICQFAPNVATNPNPIAFGPGVFAPSAGDCVCAPSAGVKTLSATSSDAQDRCTCSLPAAAPHSALTAAECSRKAGIDLQPQREPRNFRATGGTLRALEPHARAGDADS